MSLLSEGKFVGLMMCWGGIFIWFALIESLGNVIMTALFLLFLVYALDVLKENIYDVKPLKRVACRGLKKNE